MEKVLITGGSGLIGRRLSFLLKSRGYEVRILSRSNNPKNNYKTFVWNVSEQYLNDSAFEGLTILFILQELELQIKDGLKKEKKKL